MIDLSTSVTKALKKTFQKHNKKVFKKKLFQNENNKIERRKT